MPARPTTIALGISVAILVLLSGRASAQFVAGGAGNRGTSVVHTVAYRPPVEGDVLRGFDAPTPFGPGHRGLDLYAPPGTAVHAAAAGRVTFAGSVAGVVWVTVRHADGIRTSYGHLGQLMVDVGRHVEAGQLVGIAAGDPVGGRPHVHFGARDDEGYLDPARLLWPPVVLVRIDQPGQGRVAAGR